MALILGPIGNCFSYKSNPRIARAPTYGPQFFEDRAVPGALFFPHLFI